MYVSTCDGKDANTRMSSIPQRVLSTRCVRVAPSNLSPSPLRPPLSPLQVQVAPSSTSGKSPVPPTSPDSAPRDPPAPWDSTSSLPPPPLPLSQPAFSKLTCFNHSPKFEPEPDPPASATRIPDVSGARFLPEASFRLNRPDWLAFAADDKTQRPGGGDRGGGGGGYSGGGGGGRGGGGGGGGGGRTDLRLVSLSFCLFRVTGN